MIQGSKTLHFGCTHRPFRAALLRREGKASGRSFTKSSGNYFAKSSFNSFPEVLVKANMPLRCWVQRTSCLHNQRLVKIIQRHIYIRTSTGQNWWNNSQATHQLPLDLKMSAFASSSSSSSVCGKSSGETKPVPVSNQSWILMFHTKQRHNGRPKYHRPNPFRLSVVLCHLIEKGKRLPSHPAKNISRPHCVHHSSPQILKVVRCGKCIDQVLKKTQLHPFVSLPKPTCLSDETCGVGPCTCTGMQPE